MAKDNLIQFRYRRAEVVSAQQLRYRSSPRLRVVFLFGVIALIVVIAQLWLPALQTIPYLNGSLPLLAAIFFMGVPLVFYLLVPYIDFQFNREWQHGYQLEILEDKLRLAGTGSQKWVDIDLRKLRRLLHNRLVFVLVFSNEQEFFILPKLALGNKYRLERVVRLFQDHLPQKSRGPVRPRP